MKQKITLTLSLILVTFLIFWACQDDELPEPTAGVSNKITFAQVNSDSVSYRVIELNISINNTTEETITEHGICYGTNANPTLEGDKIQQGSLNGNTYSCSIENLEPNTTYHVRAYLKFREATAYSDDVTIKTDALKTPEVESVGLSFVSGVSLQVEGQINDYGGDTVVTTGIYWSFSENPTSSDSLVHATKQNDTFSALIENIITDSVYYIKPFTTNAAGTGYGTELEFNPGQLPVLTTSTVSGIYETGATCGGSITSGGGSAVTARGVCYSTNENPSLADDYTEDGSGTGTFTSTLSNLNPATVYYVRAYATNSTGTSYGNQQEFSTTGLPVLTTTAVSNVTSTTATTGGNISDDGGYTITARGVCWSTSTEPTLADSYTEDGTGTGSYTSNLTDLTINTTYYVRAYATNINGTMYGSEVSFNTNNGLPQVTTASVSDITANTATCGGNVTDDGGFAVTLRGVCWSINPNPIISDNLTADGSGTGTFTSTLDNLNTATVYYVRAYATNSNGTSYGNEQEFATTGLPVLTTTEVSNINATTATSGGSISDDGGSSITARGVCWSASANPTISDNITSDGAGTGNFSSNLSSLDINTTYYVRSYATNANGTSYGNELSFTTKDGIPVFTTNEITDITAISATSGGTITDNGGFSVTARGVCWSTSQNPTISDSYTTDGSGIGAFASNLTGLVEWSTYYVRSYVTNDIGLTYYGNEFSFMAYNTNEYVFDYDGNVYGIVQIGNQIWMAANLKTTHYADGTAISLVTDNTVWADLVDNNTDDAYCYYNNNSSGEADTYGALYTWAAAMNGAASSTANPSGIQGACPDGWHLPSDAEWTEMDNFIASDGHSDQEGATLKSTTGWNSDGNGTNIYGFDALPGGIRLRDTGSFFGEGDIIYYLSSTETDSELIYHRNLSYTNSVLGRGNYYKSGGFYIRCIKD